MTDASVATAPKSARKKPLFDTTYLHVRGASGLNIPGMAIAIYLWETSSAAVRFAWNKFIHGSSPFSYASNYPLINKSDRVPYYVCRDENGVLRGGNPAWMYLQDLIRPETLSDKDKVSILRYAISRLPSNVAFEFSACPYVKDADIVRKAFTRSGFVHSLKKTYMYKGNPGEIDPAPRFKSDARNKINSARRDMETVPMGIEEFFRYYEENLKGAGKDSYFHLEIDKEIAREAMRMSPPRAHIIAVRRKQTDQNAPHPVDAAILCTGSAEDDGYLKLFRITYRHADPAKPEDAPHKHATKLVIVEAMQMANQMGLTLDTDGYTPGGETLYSRFGVFEAVMRTEYKRKTIHIVTAKLAAKADVIFRRALNHIPRPIARNLARGGSVIAALFCA